MFWCHHCCLVAFSWLQKNFTLLLSQKTPPLLAIALIITCKYAQNIPKTGSFCFFFSLGSMSTELPCNGRSSERKPNKSKLLRTCSLETQFYSWIISFVNSSCRHCPKVLAFVFQRQTWGKKKKKSFFVSVLLSQAVVHLQEPVVADGSSFDKCGWCPHARLIRPWVLSLNR